MPSITEPKDGSSTNSPSHSNIPPTHFPSYQSELRSFDPIPPDSTTISIESNLSSPSLSLDSLLHKVTRSLADINEQAVEHILQSKEDIWHNPDLPHLVKEYFSSSSQVLAFYSAFQEFIKKIRNSHILIQRTVTQFHEEKTQPGNRFSTMLRELESPISAGDPFTDEFFFTLFRSVYDQQVLMQSKLQAKREKLDKKLKGLTSYWKVSNVLFAAVFVAVVIWSVVAVATAEPPLVAALLAASSAPLGTVGKWMSSLWKGYEGGVKKELDLVSEMDLDTFIAVTELQNIQILVEKLKDKIEELLSKVAVAVEQEDEVVVGLAIDDIKKNSAVFTQAVDVLGERAYKYGRDIGRAREVILQRIKNF